MVSIQKRDELFESRRETLTRLREIEKEIDDICDNCDTKVNGCLILTPEQIDTIKSLNDEHEELSRVYYEKTDEILSMASEK